MLLVGRGGNDEKGGIQIPVSAGDVIVLPAGTSHCSVESTPDYRYIGVYVKVRVLKSGQNITECGFSRQGFDLFAMPVFVS